MRTLKTMMGVAIIAGSLAIAVPAGAHTAAVSGTATCSNGSHVVTWTITNGLAKKPMAITATAAASGVAYSVTGLTNPVPGAGTTTGTTVVPGSVTGDVVLTVVATWPDGFTRTETATVGLPTPCAASGTTTSTTTSTVPQSVEGVSTLAPTTTGPTAVAGVECGPSTLACTGSSDTGSEVAIGFGLLIVGAGLVALKRRPAPSR